MLARGEHFLRAAVVSDVAVFSISPPLLAAEAEAVPADVSETATDIFFDHSPTSRCFNHSLYCIFD